MVRRIKKTEKITSTADYQIQKLRILGNSTAFIEQELKKTLDLSYPEIWALYDKVADWEYVRYKDAYEQINESFVPLEDNEQIQQWSQAIVSQTEGEPLPELETPELLGSVENYEIFMQAIRDISPVRTLFHPSRPLI